MALNPVKHCVLIVDNDRQSVEALLNVLRDFDYELLTASNGQEALQMIIHNHPSLVISEWNMPVMDGLNLFLQVKESPLTRHIPFIFFTSIDDAGVRLALLESGAEDYWSKPYDMREARLKIRRLLDRIDPATRFRSKTPIPTGGMPELINGRYEIVQEIGHGGMGVVYKALDLGLDREVALKILRKDLVADEIAVRRFAREAEAAMRIVHKNVIATYEYGLIPNGQAYIAMELLDGYPLEQELAFGPVDQKRCLMIMRQTLDAVRAAHRQNVIHRDLKPSNIFLIKSSSPDPLVKVLDFGIAMLKDLQQRSPKITHKDVTVGTPIYLSPEQAMANTPDERSDIYSLGIVFYELLTGRPPFIGQYYREVMIAHLADPVPPIDPSLGVSDWLVSLVEKMLAKHPSDRPQSVGEVIDLIDLNV
ncbi:MAG: protein kinase [Acidobacteriota bacterium]|nr:protein kinase [Blastocatellia bacterium]MDW8411902.1 protein kinase [Acidobacteriota bacterium]